MTDFRRPLKTIQNSRGMISAEFLFSLVLSVGLCIVLFTLTFTLSMVEVAQYIAFSASRAHAAGHITMDKQIEMGHNKYNRLVNHKTLKALFNDPNGNWFKLTGFEIRSGGISGQTFDEYKVSDGSDLSERIPQVGVRFNFVAAVLDRRLHFLGGTSENPGSDPFSARVAAMLIREPTMNECQNQIKDRYDAILDLNSGYAIGNAGRGTYEQYPSEDSGC